MEQLETWVQVQKTTFERWVNKTLMRRQLEVVDLFEDLRDGVLLCVLVEMLCRSSIGHYNKKPRNVNQRLENCQFAIERVVRDGVKLVNIGPSDIEAGNGKLTLGLIWSIILKYQIGSAIEKITVKKPGVPHVPVPPVLALLEWLRMKLQPKGLRPNNLTRDWNDGIMLAALVDAVAPGLFPDWDKLPRNQPVQNITTAVNLARDWLGVPVLISPIHIADPKVDEKSMMTYLSQFVNAVLRPGAPIGQHKAPNAGNVRVYGPALERDVLVNTETKFYIDATDAGPGTIGLSVGGPGEPDIKINQTPGKPQEVLFKAAKAGDYDVVIKFQDKEIPHSPVRIHVIPEAADPTKVKVQNISPIANVGKVNNFIIDASKAGGSGYLEIGILGPTQPANQIFVEHIGDYKFEVKFVVVEKGTFLVSVKWHGEHVPGSPFEIVGQLKN